MISKPSLSFYTNIPTPYQLAFFNELSKRFQLTVVYYSHKQSDRYWNFDVQNSYKVVLLENNAIAKAVQKKVLDFHFSWQIFKTAWRDNSQYVIIGGSYWIPDGAFALLIQRWKKKKVAYFSEPLFEVSNKIKYAVKWSTLRILNLCCDAIFCTSSKAAETFTQYGVKPPKFIIPYNIDAQTFAQVDEDKKTELNNRYKRNGELVLLSSGSLIHRKGMDVLINAVKSSDLQNIKLIIIGEGPEREHLEALIANDTRIVLAGFQQPDEIPPYFAMADIFVFASRYDGWAVVINEAIAANVPIISSTNVGAAVEMITSVDLGLLCTSDDIDCFRKAIEELAADKEKRETIRQNMQSLVPLISSDYNADKVLDIFLNRLP